jgi:hypothetical protein
MSVGAANDNTRLAAIGGLNNPLIFDRNAEGSDLLTWWKLTEPRFRFF